MKDLISIIIPVYNVENLLDKCLTTVSSQTYDLLEIILVDDGSTDNSGRICDEWAIKDSRIRVLHKDNEGVARARNDALKIAKGDYIGFVDPDDWIEKNMFEVLLLALRKYSADIVICGFDEVNNDIKRDKIPKGLRVYNRQEALYELILDKGVRSYCWDKLFRKECMVENPFPAVKRISDLGGIHKFFQKANTVLQLNEKLYHRIRRKNGLVTVDGPLETRTDYCIAQQYRYEDLLFEEEKLRTAIQEQYLAALESMQQSFYTNDKTTGNNIEDCLFKINNIILPFYLTHIEDLRKLTKFTIEYENELTLFLKNPLQTFAEGNLEIPIVMAADNNYAYPLFVSLASVFASANNNTTYEVHLLLNKNFSKINFERLAMLQKGFGRHKVEVHIMDAEYDDIKINIEHIKSPTFYRLELPKLLPDVNKCIYLDVDTIVNRDLSELFRLNIDDKYIAGVRAPVYYYPEDKVREHLNRLGIDNIFSYVNAGVLLMNLEKMRKDCLTDVFFELIKKDFPSMDQDILNSACYGKIRIIHPKYNAMTKYSLKDDGAYLSMVRLQLAYTLEEWNSARKRPVIIHYADKVKPWDDLSVDYADKWWRVAVELPFFKELYQHYFKQQTMYVDKVKNQVSQVKQQYAKYSTLRMDIRNKGEKGCNVIEKNVSPAPLFIRRPDWLRDGITIESESGSMTVELQCQGNGELEIGLLGRDVRNAEGKRYPVWIDCTYFAVNGEAVFAETKTVCHDKRYVYRKPVVDGEIVKLEVAWSECRSSNVLDEYRQLQTELKNSNNKINQLKTEMKNERKVVFAAQEQISTLHKQYEKYSVLRMDIRNRGDEGSDVIEQAVTPQPLSVRKPQWLPGGITVESAAERMSVDVQCKGDGQLEIGLMGRDVRNEDGKRYPVWIDCTYFAVNGEVVFSDTKTVCHDKRYVYRRPVADGEIVKLEVGWSECRSSNVLDEYRQLQTELKNSNNKINQLQVELKSLNYKTDQLQKANAKTLKNLNETKRKDAKLDKELQNIKNGWSFKIGRVITWVPRKIRGLLK